jgi:4-amino-4-deoxy-L-arabinose transferase-like glycosyltransferase
MTLLAAVIGFVIGYLVAGHAELDHFVGAVACLVGASFGCIVVSDIVFGAGRREGGGGGAIGFLVSLVAVVVAVAALLVPDITLLVIIGLAWLGIARHRRAQRKHEGLRVLR